MVMLDDDDSLNRDEREHNRKIADYLNRHPMFRYAGDGKICKMDFFLYIRGQLQYATDDPDKMDRMEEAIWISGDYDGITVDDCDWFFGIVEGLWRECYNVQSSGFFAQPEPLPVVPRGLLKVPDKI